jgi:hypothetical protein
MTAGTRKAASEMSFWGRFPHAQVVVMAKYSSSACWMEDDRADFRKA